MSSAHNNLVSFLPVLHACLVRYALLQRQAIHLEEVFHVLDLGSDSLLSEPLEFGLVCVPRRLVQTLVRVVAADAAPYALAVGHGQHLASAAATTALPHAARPCWSGDLQIFGGESGFPAPDGPPRVPSRKHDCTLFPTTPLSHTFKIALAPVRFCHQSYTLTHVPSTSRLGKLGPGLSRERGWGIALNSTGKEGTKQVRAISGRELWPCVL